MGSHPNLITKLRDAWSAYYLRAKRRFLIARAIHKRLELNIKKERTHTIRKNDILCIVVLRNEMPRLSHFLSHYRGLGVDHFLMIDNDSTDGTIPFLQTQTDVSFWSTQASYRYSRFGMDWANWLLLRYGRNHWCVTVDADELLIYPHWQTRPLTALTEWLDRHKIQVLPGLMLDLYPNTPVSYGRAQDDNPLSVLRWFDAGNYMFQPQTKTGGLWIQGGVRTRHFFKDRPRLGPTLNKIPLIKWNWRYAYVNSTHSALPSRLNKTYEKSGGESISGVLLHTKFLPDIIDKSSEEIDRRQHFADPTRYQDYYANIAADPILHCEYSQEYKSWRHLEAIGLMSRGGWL